MEERLSTLERKIEALTQLLDQRIPQYPNYTRESSSYICLKQIHQPSSEEELIDALWNEIKKDKSVNPHMSKYQ